MKKIRENLFGNSVQGTGVLFKSQDPGDIFMNDPRALFFYLYDCWGGYARRSYAKKRLE